MTESVSATPPETATTAAPEVYTWDTLGLSAAALEVIAKAGFLSPTPVQAKAIPIALEGHDVIASAQTGTGKTASFALPMIEKFVGREGTFGLILAPTREIVLQILDTVQKLGAPRGIRSISLIGGIDMKIDATALASYPHIVVATPGRLCDHIERGNIWLDFIQMVVLDEADRMLDMGFSDQLSKIMKEVPQDRQTMLFSATITPSIDRLAQSILHDPQRVSIGRPLSAAAAVEQRLLWMKEESKNRELRRLISEEKGSIIVFTRSKDGASRVWRSLHSYGIYDATYIHSDRLQAHREAALTEFKSGKYRVLIATDVAGRGIHVDDIAHVVNYDLPREPEDYVHRIGRTGRKAASGKATSFVTHRDREILRRIEKLLGKPIPSFNADNFDPDAPEDRAPRDSHSRGKGARRAAPPEQKAKPPSGNKTPIRQNTPGQETNSASPAVGSEAPLSANGKNGENDADAPARKRRRRGPREPQGSTTPESTTPPAVSKGGRTLLPPVRDPSSGSQT